MVWKTVINDKSGVKLTIMALINTTQSEPEIHRSTDSAIVLINSYICGKQKKHGLLIKTIKQWYLTIFAREPD